MSSQFISLMLSLIKKSIPQIKSLKNGNFIPSKINAELLDDIFSSYKINTLDQFNWWSGINISFSSDRIVISDYKNTNSAIDTARKLEEYTKIKNLLKKYYPKAQDLIDNFKLFVEPIDNLLHIIFNQIYIDIASNKYSEESVVNYISIIKQELEQQSYEYLLLGKIVGLTIENDLIEIQDDVQLYKKIDWSNNKYINEIIEQFDFNNLIFGYDFNISIQKKEESDIGVVFFIKIIQTILRLYKLGSIFLNGSIFKKTLISTKNRIFIEPPNYKEKHNYKILKNERDSFRNFVNTFFIIFKNHYKSEAFRPISIALERYEWALLENVSVDRKLMYAVMGLEPLLLKERDTSGQSYALSLRLSQLLQCYDIKDENLRTNIVDAYRYRNKVVHGREYPDGWEDLFDEILPQILNYLRITIIFMLLNVTKKDQDVEKLIALIDSAIMSEKSQTKLQKQVNKDFSKFKTSFTL